MKRVYYASMYLLFAVVFLNEIFYLKQSIFILLVTLGFILLLTSCLLITKGFQLYVSVASLLIGHLILFKYNLGFQVWYDSLAQTIGIPILFVAIPMISFPIKYGNYLESVENYVVSRRQKPSFLFSFLVLLHLALTVVLNIGSIPTMQKLLDHIKLPKKFLSRLYTAGYSSYVVFSPYDGLVNMILLMSSITYSEYFFNGLLMVIVIITISTLFIKMDKDLLEDLNNSLAHIKSDGARKKIYELLLHVVILIFLAFLGDRFIPLSNQLYIIAVIIIFYSLFWGFLIKGLNKYKDEIREYSANLLGFKSMLPFLISANFLGSMITYTPIKENISLMLMYLNSLPLYFIIQLFILLTMLLSMCGVHMMITVTTLALTVSPGIIGLSNGAFALMLLTCWYVAMSVSMFVPFTVIIAETVGEKPFSVTIKYNLKFALVMILIAPLVILFANYYL